MYVLVKVVLESFNLYGSFKAAAMLSAASQTLRGTDMALDARSPVMHRYYNS
jgi:hypothetical protein